MPFSSYAKGQTELLTLANRIGEEIADNYRQQQTAEALAEYRKEQLANRQDNTAIRRDDLNRKIDADAARNQYNYLRTLGVPAAGNSRPRTTSLPGGTVPVYAPASQPRSPKRTDNYVPYGTLEDNALFAGVKRRVPLTEEQNKILSERLKPKAPTVTQYNTVVDKPGEELLLRNGVDTSNMSNDEKVAAFTDLINRIALSTRMEKAEQERSNLQDTINLENAGADMEAEAEFNKWALPTGPNPLAAVAKLSNQYNAAVQEAEKELMAREKELNRVQNLSGLEARQKLENEIYAKHRVPELKKAWDDLRIPVESAMSGYELLPAEKGGNDVIGTTPDGKPLTYNQHMQNLRKEKLAEIQGMISSYNQTVADRVYRKPRPDAELVLPTDAEITAERRKIIDESPEYFRIEERQVERDKNHPDYRRYEAMQQAYNKGDYYKVISLMTPEERKAAGIDVRAVNNYIKRENAREQVQQYRKQNDFQATNAQTQTPISKSTPVSSTAGGTTKKQETIDNMAATLVEKGMPAEQALQQANSFYNNAEKEASKAEEEKKNLFSKKYRNMVSEEVNKFSQYFSEGEIPKNITDIILDKMFYAGNGSDVNIEQFVNNYFQNTYKGNDALLRKRVNSYDYINAKRQQHGDKFSALTKEQRVEFAKKNDELLSKVVSFGLIDENSLEPVNFRTITREQGRQLADLAEQEKDMLKSFGLKGKTGIFNQLWKKIRKDTLESQRRELEEMLSHKNDTSVFALRYRSWLPAMDAYPEKQRNFEYKFHPFRKEYIPNVPNYSQRKKEAYEKLGLDPYSPVLSDENRKAVRDYIYKGTHEGYFEDVFLPNYQKLQEIRKALKELE